MTGRQINKSGGAERTFVLIFETGDEVMGGLQHFAEENRLCGSHFAAIGALRDVVLAWFNVQTRQYQRIPISEQVEVLSLNGDIAADERGGVKVHAHIVIGKSDGSAHGGHLVEGHVRPTLEVIVTELPQHLQRVFDPKSGLALIRV
jgi:uncharacterized protein